MRSDVEVVDGRPALVRRGPTAVIAREAQALHLAAGPGVPAVLVEDQAGDACCLALEVAPPLPEGLDDSEVRQLGVVLAAALARAHAAGVVHGPLRDTDLQAGPLLGGWAGARLPGDATGPSPADDVAGLAILLLRRCSSPSDELRAVLERAATPDPTGRPSAAALADALRPSASRSGRDLTDRATRVAPRTRRAAIGVGFLAVIGGLAAAGAARAGGTDAKTRPSATVAAARPTTTTTAATTVRRRAVVTGNVVVFEGRRWTVGEPGDVLVAGDFDCDGVDAVVLLRPSTGEVWSFDEWADGPRIGRLLATVPGATTLRAVPMGRCDDLQALGADASSTWVAV